MGQINNKPSDLLRIERTPQKTPAKKKMATISVYIDENQGCKAKPIARGQRKVLGDIHNVIEQKPKKLPGLTVPEPIQEETSDKYLNLYDYINDIYNYLRKIEGNLLVSKNYLNGQGISKEMRAVLIEWLCNVHSFYHLLQETFQLSIYIMDSYIEKSGSVTKENAQIVLLASVFIAAKYEETEALEITDLLQVCEPSIPERLILFQETNILKTLDYKLGQPLPLHFLRRYSKISGATPVEHNYAKYFTDLSLLDAKLISVKPSLLASACIYLAFCVARDKIDKQFWSDTLIRNSSYKYQNFARLLPRMAQLIVDVSKNNNSWIRKKYEKTTTYCVSLMPGVQPVTGIVNLFIKNK